MMSIKKKLAIVGDSYCGKTCILMAFCDKKFCENPEATVFDNTMLTVECDGQLVDLQLWDTAGQEGYDRIRRLTYTNTAVFIMCYSIAEPDSLANIKHTWVSEVRSVCPGVPILLVGNKMDLRDDPKTLQRLAKKKCVPVSPAEGREMAEQCGVLGMMECSAKTGQGVKEVLMAATRAALSEGRPPVEEKKKKKKKKKKCCGCCCCTGTKT